jgi:hypothetical protein
MAEIRNDTVNFSFGRSPSARLTLAMPKLAFAEMDRIVPGFQHG